MELDPLRLVCRVYFGTDGCDLPRGHADEDRLDSHRCICHPGRSAADFAAVYGEDAQRLGLKGWEQT